MNPKLTDIVIVGAGAAGLMAALELSKAGKSILILEARDRIGGRIWPLSGYNYPAQGGAEFVHGQAPITHELVSQAGLTYKSSTGKLLTFKDGQFDDSRDMFLENEILQSKLKEVKHDLPIADFLNEHFSDEKYQTLRDSIIRMVEGYDAADPKRISTLSLRDEWLGQEDEWIQGRIQEGYGPLLEYLRSECMKHGVQIILNKQVKQIEHSGPDVKTICIDGGIYYSKKIVVTAPLPLIGSIDYVPSIPQKIQATKLIGYGHVIKVVVEFKEKWWIDSRGRDLSKVVFVRSKEFIPTWWTQNPQDVPVLVGWLAGPKAKDHSGLSDSTIMEKALESLENIFDHNKESIKNIIVKSEVFNWPNDLFAKGAYSYSTPESEDARQELVKSADNRIYFAGEALYSGKETATVEGALGSGKEVAERILSK